LCLARRSHEALEAIEEAESLAERFESRAFDALFLRLRGVFLTAIGAEERKLNLRFARPSESQKSRNRFCWRNAPKQRTQNIFGKKRAPHEDVDSGSLFDVFLERAVFPFSLWASPNPA
jgi:hypothetical protein